LVVNGVPVFAKGANLIPFDSFPSRATPARERALLQAAHDANMNLLRVWGGGIYPDDAFFKEADRLGLMIWQDFMFGGAIPPHDEAFRANVEVEARQQVRQLRDHASLVLWCGNNEIATAWDSWGQREKMLREAGAAETARIDAGLHALFDHTLREVVAQESPDVPYWPSSPDSSADDAKANDPNDGDYHAWDVWSGSAPIAHYLKVTPRFQSEYGLQSFPALATLRDFAAPAELDADSRVMRAHQKFDHGNGNIRLLHYVRGNYGDPRDFADLVYLSQVMQAEGIELAADHLRSAAPRSMGSLYWQLNDVWPGITWSSIDYDGRWKALHYHARRFYAPLRLVAIRDGGATRVWLVSDRGDALAGRLDVRVMDFEGRVYSHRSDVVRAAARASTHVLTLDDAALLHGADPRRRMAVFEWRVGGRVVSRRLVFFRPPRKLALPQPALQVALRADDRGTVLDITAKRLAREVWIDFGDLDVRPSDDAFDLLPGEHRQVRLTTRVDIATLRRALQVRSLADAIWPAHKAATP
jgi:beta-mannosidase